MSEDNGIVDNGDQTKVQGIRKPHVARKLSRITFQYFPLATESIFGNVPCLNNGQLREAMKQCVV